MGSITYDFLANSVLFNQNEIKKNYRSLTDNQIEDVLLDYRNHCLGNISGLQNEIKENKSSLKVLSGIEKIPYETLKQGALYFDQFIIYDPLFQFGHQKGEATNVLSDYLGFQREQGIDRKKLGEIASLLKTITPMIAADYVKILPLSYSFEPPKDVPIKLPVNYYADDLPKELMDFCRERVVLQSMKPVEGGWQILNENDLTPGIFISFNDLEKHHGLIYNYFYQQWEETEDKRYRVRLELAEYPVDKKEWDIWTYQSINKSAKTVVDKILYENMVATDLKATYLTDNTFTSDILKLNLGSKETVETSSATQFMNIELPFLDDVDIHKLMNVREFEAETFTNFRIELERQFRELRYVTDPYEIELRKENIIHEIGKVQVKKIDQKFSQLKRKGLIDASILLGGLAGTVQTAGWSLLASAIAISSGYKTYNEYKEKLKENPSYLLWKSLKKK